MKTYIIPHTDLVVSRIAYGCASFGWHSLGKFAKLTELAASEGFHFLSKADEARVVHIAYDNGITFFDNAAAYGFGNAEAAFGDILKQSSGLRNKIVIQTKCGICYPGQPNPDDPPRMDVSREHILSSAEASLRKMHTDYLDILLLHWPDALVEPEEVAKAFDELHRSGKVRYFGVSNHTAAQMALLQEYVRQPLVANQVKLSLLHSHVLSDGREFMLSMDEHLRILTDFVTTGKPIAMEPDRYYAGVADSGTLDYCRLKRIQVQAYSPVRGELLTPRMDPSPQVRKTAQLLNELAKQNNATPSAVALAWLLRHPAGIVPVIGATDPRHVIESCRADDLTLTREEWYPLFVAASAFESRKLLSAPAQPGRI
jgi:predicted oxidoreductase